MKKKNNSIKLLTFMCFIVCMMCTIQTSPMANIMESCDFERLKESYESVQN